MSPKKKSSSSSAPSKDRELVFVPSLLQKVFSEQKITKTNQLFRLKPDTLIQKGGWGEKKVAMVVALQTLYTKISSAKPNTIVPDIAPPILLRGTQIGQVTIEELINDSSLSKTSDVYGLLHHDGLGILLASATVADRSFSCLHNFEEMKMHWRDVPLVLSKRLVDFLDAQAIDTMEQVDQFATFGRCKNSKGKQVELAGHGNFGLHSHGELRRVLKEVDRIGLRQHQQNICCCYDQLPDPTTDWESIPMRFSARVKKFFAKHKLNTIEEIYRFAIRPQVSPKKSGKLVDAISLRQFGLDSLQNLREELQKLAELGVDGYRFGGGGRPTTVNAFITALESQLPPREFEALRLRAEGLTLEEMGSAIKRTRERARQLVVKAIKSAAVFVPAAEEILIPLDEKLSSGDSVWDQEATKLLGCNDFADVRMLALVAGYEYALKDN